MKKVTDYLQEFGLTELEAMLYQGLLETGPTTIMGLAEHVGIKRITTHFNIENLITKGLVTQSIQGARRQIIAEQPERLEYLIEQKERSVSQLKNDFPDFIKTLYSALPQSKPDEKEVEIKYYTGTQGVRSIYQEVLDAKEVRSYVNINRIFDLFPENPQLFPNIMSKRLSKMWEIVEDSVRSREYLKKINPKNYRYKFFPKNWDQKLFYDYMIFDNRVVIITAQGNTVSGILIHNENIYKNSLYIFNMVWDLLPNAI